MNSGKKLALIVGLVVLSVAASFVSIVLVIRHFGLEPFFPSPEQRTVEGCA